MYSVYLLSPDVRYFGCSSVNCLNMVTSAFIVCFVVGIIQYGETPSERIRDSSVGVGDSMINISRNCIYLFSIVCIKCNKTGVLCISDTVDNISLSNSRV